MTADAVTVHEDDTLEVLRRMLRHEIHRLPVVCSRETLYQYLRQKPGEREHGEPIAVPAPQTFRFRSVLKRHP